MGDSGQTLFEMSYDPFGKGAAAGGAGAGLGAYLGGKK